MILSDRDLQARLDAGDLVITPLHADALQPASIDVRLGPQYLRASNTLAILDTRQPLASGANVRRTMSEDGLVLRPQEFVLGATMERVRVPPDLVLSLHGRSSLGRLGITVHVTAGHIDPGFEGHITLEIANLGMQPVRLYTGDRIAQLVVHALSSPCARPYGAGRGSRYHGHTATGPVASRIGSGGSGG